MLFSLLSQYFGMQLTTSSTLKKCFCLPQASTSTVLEICTSISVSISKKWLQPYSKVQRWRSLHSIRLTYRAQTNKANLEVLLTEETSSSPWLSSFQAWKFWSMHIKLVGASLLLSLEVSFSTWPATSRFQSPSSWLKKAKATRIFPSFLLSLPCISRSLALFSRSLCWRVAWPGREDTSRQEISQR